MSKTKSKDLIEGFSAVPTVGHWSEAIWRSTAIKYEYCQHAPFVSTNCGEEDDLEGLQKEGTLGRRRLYDLISRHKRKIKSRIDLCFGVFAYTPRIGPSEKSKLLQRKVEKRLARLRSCKRFALEATAYKHDHIDRWLRKYAGSQADDILSFCKTHDIVNEVNNAVKLAEKCFRTEPENVHLEVDVDPETDDTKIVIIVKVHNRTTQDILTSYDDYVDQAIKILPRSKSGFIRLSYDVSSSA
jgi:hypothetical protein